MFMYSYCMFMYLHRASWHSSATLTEVFPCFFLSCKANDRVKPAKTGHGPHSSKTFVLLYVLFVLCRSLYCVFVNVYCTAVTGWLPNISYHIISSCLLELAPSVFHLFWPIKDPVLGLHTSDLIRRWRKGYITGWHRNHYTSSTEESVP